jgi:hypothetical protein
VDQVLRTLLEVPLRVAAQPRPVVEDAQDLRRDPLAVRAQHANEVGGVVVQVPQAVHVLALEAAGLARVEECPALVVALASAVSPLLPAKQPALLHQPAHRGVRRHVAERRVELGLRDQVVGVELVAPARVVAMLFDQHRDQRRRDRAPRPGVLADAAPERVDGIGVPGPTSEVQPAFQGRVREADLCTRDRVLPRLGRECLDGGA